MGPTPHWRRTLRNVANRKRLDGFAGAASQGVSNGWPIQAVVSGSSLTTTSKLADPAAQSIRG
jgi:hypothetical protein